MVGGYFWGMTSFINNGTLYTLVRLSYVIFGKRAVLSDGIGNTFFRVTYIREVCLCHWGARRILCSCPPLTFFDTTMAPLKQHAYMLLTWSQAGEDFDYHKAVELIGDHGGECLIAHERHQDGGHHYHAFVHFSPRLRTRNTSIFDVDGCHPNWRPKKDWGSVEAMIGYLFKDEEDGGGEIVAGGLDPGKYFEESPEKMSRDDKAKLVLQATSEAEAWALVAEHLPSNTLFNFNNIKSWIGHRFDRKEEKGYTVQTGRTFDLSNYPELQDWVDLELRLEIPGKCVSFLGLVCLFLRV